MNYDLNKAFDEFIKYKPNIIAYGKSLDYQVLDPFIMFTGKYVGTFGFSYHEYGMYDEHYISHFTDLDELKRKLYHHLDGIE